MYRKRLPSGGYVIYNGKYIQTSAGTIANPSEKILKENGYEYYVPDVKPNDAPSDYELLEAVKKMLSTQAEELSDEDALEVAALFPTWASKIGKTVERGERLWWDGRLWRTLQKIDILLENWTPDVAVSLFAEVSVEEWPEIPENIPSTSPWMAGDKGTWKGQHYICQLDNCVWNPDVAPQFWELVA